MDFKQITEVASAETLDPAASFLVTQPEEVDGQTVEKLKRVPRSAAFSGYGAALATASPVSQGSDTYVATGDHLPAVEVATSSPYAHPVGKGRQIVFIPTRKNLTDSPSLKLNDGQTIPIRMRSSRNQGNDDSKPDAAVNVPAGCMMRGVPYIMTFCGKYWLVDSYIVSGNRGGGSGVRYTINGKEADIDGNFHFTSEDLPDAVPVDVVTSEEAVANVGSDEKLITPAGVKKIVDEYGGDAQNIKVFDLDNVSYVALFAATEDAKTAIFLAYNVGNYQPDPEEEVYSYAPTLLILKMKSFTAGVGATFEQDADLEENNMAVRKTVRVTVAPGATAGADDVITVEIINTALVFHFTETNGAWSCDEGTDGQGNAVDIKTMIYDALEKNIPIYMKFQSNPRLMPMIGLNISPSKNTHVAFFGNQICMDHMDPLDTSASPGTASASYFGSYQIRWYKATGLYRDCNVVTSAEPAMLNPITINGKVCYTAYEAISLLAAGGTT